jgi:hypothetical protein
MAVSTKRTFNETRDLLEVISTRLQERTKTRPRREYHLWTQKEVTIQGKEYEELYFAGLVEQKGYVSLHYLPIYMNPSLKDEIPPVLLKTLKGKSCFHIKELTPELEVAIRKTLKAGIRTYRDMEWL